MNFLFANFSLTFHYRLKWCTTTSRHYTHILCYFKIMRFFFVFPFENAIYVDLNLRAKHEKNKFNKFGKVRWIKKRKMNRLYGRGKKILWLFTTMSVGNLLFTFNPSFFQCVFLNDGPFDFFWRFQFHRIPIDRT